MQCPDCWVEMPLTVSETLSTAHLGTPCLCGQLFQCHLKQTYHTGEKVCTSGEMQGFPLKKILGGHSVPLGL